MMRIIRKKKNTPPVERLRKVSYSAFSAFVQKSNAPLRYYLRGYGELPPASPSKRHFIVPKITVTLPLRRFLRCRSRLSRRFSQISHSHAFAGVFHRSVGLGMFLMRLFGLRPISLAMRRSSSFRRQSFFAFFQSSGLWAMMFSDSPDTKKSRRAKPDRILLEDLAGVVGFEPTSGGFRIRCLNRTWRYPSPDMVRSERLELSWLSPQPPQGCASTNFATTASGTSNFNLRRCCSELPHLRRCAF